MSVGLDLGTTEFRSIRDSGGDLVARRCRACYVVVKDTPGHRKLLNNTKMRFGTCGDDLVVFGEDAVDCSSMLDLPVIPLLREGRLPSGDPVARQILALMVEAVLPTAANNSEVCCLTAPGGYGLDGQSIDLRFLKQLVALRGYTPQLISSGHAIVLAELSDASFSGLGISLGAINFEVGIIHCGRELARCTVPGQLGELAEEFHVETNSFAEKTGTTNATRVSWERSCVRALTGILTEARDKLVSEGSIRLIQQPTSIVCAGGILQSEGFASLFQQAWCQCGWPIKIGQTRLATFPRFTVARGGLIKAILETRPSLDRQVA